MKPFDVASLLDIPDMTTCLVRVEQAMLAAVATDNPSLQMPISRLVSARSKRLRSMLVTAVATIGGKDIDEKVIAGCAAIELVHIGSLVHDDIIDKADTRWGIPTVSSQEGVTHAILAGDYLLAKAGVVAATISSETACLISSTIAALCSGESREFTDEFNIDRNTDSFFASISDKTGALIAAACQMGGLCTNMSSAKIESSRDFGMAFGMSFQLIDDLMDLLSTSELMGKPVGNDLEEGVYTLPVLLALNGSHRKVVGSLLTDKPVDQSTLVELLVNEGYIKQVVDEIQKYNHKASAALSNIPGSESLQSLPEAYLEWAFANLLDTPYRDALQKFIAKV